MSQKIKIETLLIELAEIQNIPISKSEAVMQNKKEYLWYSFNKTLGGYCLVWINAANDIQIPFSGMLFIRIRYNLFIKKLQKLLLKN